MKPILPTIKFGDTGDRIPNLRAALLFLLGNGAVKAQIEPNRPTAAELSALANGIRDEEKSSAAFGGAAGELVLYIQIQNGLGDSLGGVVEAATAEQLNDLLRRFNVLDVADTFVVEGRAVDERGRGLPGMQVLLFAEDVYGSNPLGKHESTSEDGRYRFTFTQAEYGGVPGQIEWPRDEPLPSPPRAQAPNRLLSGPDLWVGQGPDAQHLVARTETVFNAGRHTELPDLVVSRAAMTVGISDLQRVAGLVNPRLKGLELGRLTDAQISFLARDCEEPAALIKALTIASCSARQAEGMATEFGLNSSGAHSELGTMDLQFTLAADSQLPSLEQLFTLHDDAIRSTLKHGMAQRRIPTRNAESIDAFVAWWAQLRAKVLESRRPKALDGVVQSPSDLLVAVWADNPVAHDQMAAHGDGIARWMANPAVRKAGVRAALAKDLSLSTELAAPLHTALRLNELAGGQSALLKRLWRGIKDHQAPEPLAALAKVDELGWISHAHSVADELPPGTDLSAYGRQVAARAEALMPSLTLSHRLKSDELFKQIPQVQGLIKSLETHPDLDLLDEAPAALGQRLNLSPPEVATLTGLRQFKLADWSWQDAGRALAVGISSLDDVLRLGKFGVQRRLQRISGGATQDEAAIDRLDKVAVQVMARAAGTVSMLWPGAFGNRSPWDSEGDDEADAKVRELLQLDGCVCDPCLSMLSSAAYRTDLLAFLDASIDDDALTDRRLGSVKDLLLSCDNDNIEKLQVDLAIERMENVVALPFSIALDVGETPAQQVAMPNLGSTLREALRSTTDLADSQFGPFQVTRESIPSLASAAQTTWLVADGARHWRVRSVGARLGSAASLNQLSDWTDLAPLVRALNKGVPLVPSNLGELRGITRRDLGWPLLPLALTSAEVVRRAGDPASAVRWTLRVVTEGQLKIAAGSAAQPASSKLATLRFTSPSGGSPGSLDMTWHNSVATLSAWINKFKQLPPDLLADLQRAGAGNPPVVEPVVGASDTWRYSVTGAVELVFTPGRFEVVSLTYQSTPGVDASDVEPVHRNARAYAKLNEQAFPWTLPFDESLNHARALLRATGLDRRALQEATLGIDQWLASDAWVEEVLGLPHQTALHIVSALPTNELVRTWGLKGQSTQFELFDGLAESRRSGSAEALLSWVSVVMQQARLGFGELRELLETTFVNPDRTVRIEPADECDVAKLRLVVEPGDSILDLCRRLYRFVRLWRALEWPAHELDAVLSPAFRAASSAAHRRMALRALAQVKLLQQELDQPADVLADWLTGEFNLKPGQRDAGQGRLERVAPPYERVFQNPAVRNPPDPRLKADLFQGRRQPRHPESLETLGGSVAAALGIRQSTLNDWLQAEVPDLEGVRADLAQGLPLQREADGLLALWRNVLLARALGLGVTEYAAAARLLGPSPFRSVSNPGAFAGTMAKRAAALMTWCRDVRFVQGLSLQFATLEQALAPAAPTPDPNQPRRTALGPTPSDAASMLTALQVALRAAPLAAKTPVEPLILPASRWPPPNATTTDEQRWQRWGLKKRPAPSPEWEVPNPQSAPPTNIKGRALALLSRMDVLAQQSARPIGQMRALLETRFVNFNGGLSLSPPANPTRAWSVRGLTAAHLDRLEAFVALQSATGFKTMILDLALEVLGALTPTLATAELAAELAALRALIEQTGLEDALVVAFWCGFSPRGYNTYADQDPANKVSSESLFRSVFAQGGRWDVAADGSLANPPQHWLDLEAVRGLMQALKVDQAELVSLVEQVPALPAPALDALRDVHRWLSLSRALRLSVLLQKVYRALLAGAGPTPFERPSALVAFIDSVERTRPRAGIVVERMAVLSGIDQGLVAHVLAGVLPSSPTPNSSSALQHFLSDDFVAPTNSFDATNVEASNAYSLLRALLTFAWFNTTWKLDRQTMRWLPGASSAGFGSLSLGQLSWATASDPNAFDAWMSITALFSLVRAEPALAPVLELYRAQRINPVDPADSGMAPALETLAKAFGMGTDFAAQLATRVDLKADNSMDPAVLATYLGLVRTCLQLGLADIDSLQALLDSPAVNATLTAAKTARAVVLARHGAAGAATVLREAARTVRHDRRDRLAEYLVWRDDLASPDDLLGHLLTDPFESDVRRTTRELHASATAQLFLNRSLLGFEPGVNPTCFDTARVQVIRSRVVRNASLEVLMFPHRYWRPEFNDDRSVALVNYENTLNQDEATLPNVHLAMRRYVDELIELMALKVISMYVDRDEGSYGDARRVLYQLGRTRSQPYAHYWRTCQHYQQAGMRWTGWQKIDMSIDGDWPVIFVHRRILHVAWPILREAEMTVNRPRWNMQIACTRYLSGRWSQRKLSNDEQFDGVIGLPASRTIFIDWSEASGSAQLRIFTSGTEPGFQPLELLPEPVNSQEGPFWPGFNDKNFIFVTRNTNVFKGFFVSVSLRSWFKYEWIDPATNAKWTHFEQAHYSEVGVSLTLSVRKKDAATGTESTVLSPLFHYDPLVGRYVGEWSDGFVKDGDWVTTASVRVSTGRGTYQDFVFAPQPGSNRVMDVGVKEHIFDLTALFNFNEEPARASLARESAVLSQLWRVNVDFDGQPSISSAQTRPSPLEGIPTFARGVGTTFIEVLPASARGHDVSSGSHDKDGLGILGVGGQATNSPRDSSRFELVRASHSFREPDTSVWWLEEGEAAALIDASACPNLAKPRLLPSAPDVLRAWRQKYEADVPKLICDQDRTLELARNTVPEWVMDYLPTALPAARSPIAVVSPAFDPRFIHTRDYRELQLDVVWAAVSIAEQQQKLEVARELLRLLFDPWTLSGNRRWRYYPISGGANLPTRYQLFTALCDPTGDPELKRQARMQIATALEDPFNPYALVRLRPAELRTAILAATAWNQGALGDALYLQFTNESVDRARIHYTSMLQLLGPRPQRVSSRATLSVPKSYRQLATTRAGASRLSGTLGTWHLVSTEAIQGQTQEQSPEQRCAIQQVLSLTTGYFCLPTDDSLLELWDFAADRLAKMRSGRNIQGALQALPVRDPAIDPTVLIRAARAGVGIEDALSELYAPPSHLRFQARLALAQEIIATSIPLVAGAWSAQEEADNEHLMTMRVDHELALLRLTTEIRVDELREAEANIDAMKQERETLRQEIQFLNKQLGRGRLSEDQDGIPVVDGGLRVKVVDVIVGDGSIEQVGGMGISSREASQLLWMHLSNHHATTSSEARIGAHAMFAIAAAIPGTIPSVPPAAPIENPIPKVFNALGHAWNALAEVYGGQASSAGAKEKQESLMAGFERRHDQVKQEMLSRVSRMKENGKRLAAAQIRKAIASQTHRNHLLDIEQKRQEHEYIHSGRFSTEATKRWARRKALELGQAGFRLAAEQALLAWQALRHECGEPSLPPPETRAWDNRYLGRFALEALQQSLLRMKVAYESRSPELEVTAHVSLRQLDPEALTKLRYKGSCEFEVTESHLNRGMPVALIFQRIKTLSLSIPCVVGPYTGVHAKLTILSNRYRHSDQVLGGNPMAPENFRSAFLPRTTLLTSGAQNDAGMFEVNLRGEQLLVGEGAGAHARFALELPSEHRPFDYRTISDVVLHLRYTAREGSPALAAALSGRKPVSPEAPTSVLLSCRSDFSQAWHQAQQTQGTAQIKLETSMLPYWLVHELNRANSRTKLTGIRWLDLPAMSTSLNWESERSAQKMNWPERLQLPLNMEMAGIGAALEDRLLLLEFE